MSEANINEESNVVEKNVPVFIETDGVTVQVGWASEVQETGGRVIEKFSAFKRVFLVNPIFGDGEGEIQAPIESHVDPEEDGLTGNKQSDADVLGMPPEFFHGDEEDEEARKNTQPVEGGTDESLNAAPLSTDNDGDTAVGQPLPADNKDNKPNQFTRTN